MLNKFFSVYNLEKILVQKNFTSQHLPSKYTGKVEAAKIFVFFMFKLLLVTEVWREVHMLKTF